MDLALKDRIECAYQARETLTPQTVPAEVKADVLAVIDQLDAGQLRVAEKHSENWVVNAWVKQAILLFFVITESVVMSGGESTFFDKVPLKYGPACDASLFQASGIRVVPPASIRQGAYIGPSVVLMPSFINIGAHIGAGTMVDTWATVGSCAQIGAGVHLSGGVGIGGVLEPLQASPVIIEDHCFIGARSEIVEGVIVEEGSVIAMGVYLGQSTRIYDRATDTVTYGRIPAGSVVVPGSLPDQMGRCQLSCAVIVKRVDAKTRRKVGINALLRASTA